MSGRRWTGFFAQTLDGHFSVHLPTLIECAHIPDDSSEIPTPEAAKHHPHLEYIAHFIPDLDPDAQILLLLGRDILHVHKVREQRNGPHNAPYPQRLLPGWVVVRDVCLGAAQKPRDVATYRTYVLENGRHSHFTPCPNNFSLKEKLATKTMENTLSFSNLKCLQLFSESNQNVSDGSLGSKIFERTTDDNKVAPSVEDRYFIHLMDKGMFLDDANNWVAPVPFRAPRPRLPNNREYAFKRFNNLFHTLQKKQEMKGHCLPFMQKHIWERSCWTGSSPAWLWRMLVSCQFWSLSST